MRLFAATLLVSSLSFGCADDPEGAHAGGGGSGGGGAGGDGGANAGGSTTSASNQAAGGTGGGSGGAPAFALEVSTELDGASLVLRCNLPREVEACLALEEVGAPCADLDEDGLVDAWEDVVLDRLRPIILLDEDEKIVDDPTGVIGIVGRVAPEGSELRVYMMLGYSRDYGSCGGFTAHDGDSERVALALAPRPGGGAGDAQVAAAYTAAHEGTANDHGRVFLDDELGLLTVGNDPVLAQPRWFVFASANKHATYASKSICEGISFVPCLDEDCGADGVSDPATYAILAPYLNAGEPTHSLVTDLSAIGFPGELPFAEQSFCGGLGGSGCSSPVREKLIDDPF